MLRDQNKKKTTLKWKRIYFFALHIHLILKQLVGCGKKFRLLITRSPRCLRHSCSMRWAKACKAEPHLISLVTISILQYQQSLEIRDTANSKFCFILEPCQANNSIQGKFLCTFSTLKWTPQTRVNLCFGSYCNNNASYMY